MADGRATKLISPTEFSGMLGAVAGIAEAMKDASSTTESVGEETASPGE